MSHFKSHPGRRVAIVMAGSLVLVASAVALAGCSTSSATVNQGPMDAAPPPGADGGSVVDASGADSAGPWGCLSSAPVAPDPSTSVVVSMVVIDGTQPVTFASTIDGGSDLDLVTYTPLPGVSVSPCNALDIGCTKPVSAPETTDLGGRVGFTLNGGFGGFYRLTGPNLVPSTFYPGAFPAGTTQTAESTAMLTYAFANIMGSALGTNVTLDAGTTNGEVIFTVFDCQDHYASGVTVTLSPNGFGYYVRNNLPSASLTETDLGGTGGAFNVPAGTVSLTAKVAATQAPIGSFDVQVLPGEFTFVWFRTRTR